MTKTRIRDNDIGPTTRLARASDSTLAGKCRPKRTGDDRHSAVTKSAEREYFYDFIHNKLILSVDCSSSSARLFFISDDGDDDKAGSAAAAYTASI